MWKKKKSCPVCEGKGGFYATYGAPHPRDWESCTHCDGTGKVDDDDRDESSS